MSNFPSNFPVEGLPCIRTRGGLLELGQEFWTVSVGLERLRLEYIVYDKGEFWLCASYARFKSRHCFPCDTGESLALFRDELSRRIGSLLRKLQETRQILAELPLPELPLPFAATQAEGVPPHASQQSGPVLAQSRVDTP